MNKIFAFDYMLSLFEQWHKEVDVNKGHGDFSNNSKLSVLKLLFLAAAPKEEGGRDLLETFNNFCALPYGPVESDIYNAIQGNELPSYKVTERSIINKAVIDKLYNEEDYLEVKEAVDALKKENEELILLNAFDLVNITHKWESWKSSFGFANFMGIQSYSMSANSIRQDANKCFR